MRTVQKKLSAFTIAELLVVLVISAIAIGIAMLVLNLVQTQVRTISSNYNKQTEMRILEKTLWRDLNTHRLFYDPVKQQLECISEKDTIIYSFTANYTTRNTDTLKVPVYKTIPYIEGTVATTATQIDAIELQLKKEQTQKKIFISTTKDAAFYINGI